MRAQDRGPWVGGRNKRGPSGFCFFLHTELRLPGGLACWTSIMGPCGRLQTQMSGSAARTRLWAPRVPKAVTTRIAGVSWKAWRGGCPRAGLGRVRRGRRGHPRSVAPLRPQIPLSLTWMLVSRPECDLGFTQTAVRPGRMKRGASGAGRETLLLGGQRPGTRSGPLRQRWLLPPPRSASSGLCPTSSSRGKQLWPWLSVGRHVRERGTLGW